MATTTPKAALTNTTRWEPDMPAALLRPACHLEVLIPARDEARRLPDTLMHTVRYLEKQPYSSSFLVCRGDRQRQRRPDI